MDDHVTKYILKFRRDPDLPLPLVHGVFGGVNPMGEIELNFFSESEDLPDRVERLVSNADGAVLNEESLRKLADCLYKAQERFGHPIYIISDEPYRELVYDMSDVPSPIQFYDNTVVCYSYSKSLSLPVERIGYYAVSDRATDREKVFASLAGAARSYGYVNPPSLMQRVIEACLNLKPDIRTYKENRDILCGILDEVKMPYIHPD